MQHYLQSKHAVVDLHGLPSIRILRVSPHLETTGLVLQLTREGAGAGPAPQAEAENI